MFVVAGTAEAVDFSVGNEEVIYTKSQRTKKKLSTWPDGSLGVARNADGSLSFYGPNGGSPAKTTGTLADPGWGKQTVSITNKKQKFDYIAGGPIYQDPATGMRLMVYHAEKHGKSSKDYHSMLGLAASTDPKGLSFRDLGVIVETSIPKGVAEMGGGTFAVVGDYFHVYFRDTDVNRNISELAVARAPISQLISNALTGQGTSFTKYYNGGWTESGRGGRSSGLEIGNPQNSWASVSYNDYLKQYVMVSSHWSGPQPDLYMATSPDGLNWSPRQAIDTGPGEQMYPSLIGTGWNPTHTDKSFYVYYTDSLKGGWNRWKDAQLVRREITLDPYGSPYGTDPADVGLGHWTTVAEYGADFQAGRPAAGWKYMWNPTGQRGNAATYAPLVWSDVAHEYNTTGGATMLPTSITHPDDYLTLKQSGGHPGNPRYSPIAGYTIQAEDGDGIYRLTETSIQKADTVQSYNEDPLSVQVYVNNTLLGSAQTVSTSGLTTSFGRELGQLNVGDTVWVAIDPLATNWYDGFTNFNFSIQKSVSDMAGGTMMATSSLAAVAEVPEPGTAGMLLAALVGGYLLRRRRK